MPKSQKSKSSNRPALFLDRDGCINVDRVYINDPKLMSLLPGAASAIAQARQAGYAIVVVTNQSGVGRGIIKKEALPKIHARLDALLLEESPEAKIDRYQICPHSPEEDCDCRKPSPKLVLNAAIALNLDISRSAFIGDKISDVETGENAGCAWNILLETGKGAKEKQTVAAKRKKNLQICADLSAAVALILAANKDSSSKA
jgi:histidinol-phosphate phosphatase family protein